MTSDPHRRLPDATSDAGVMRVHLRHADTLRRMGLTSFDAVVRSTSGRCLRALKVRENWYLPPPEADGSNKPAVDPTRRQGQPTPGMFLKKHHTRTWWTRLRAALGLGPGGTAARREARYCAALRDAGVPNMCIAAMGERLRGDGRLESFLLTEELAGFMQLDCFMQQRFPPRPHGRARPRDPAFDRLIGQTARLVRRLHRAGFNHRDLYCCHLFVRETSLGRFALRLIDLQRVQHRRRWRRRWLVKDLGQLAYSAPRDRIGCTERLRFLREYLGVRRLRPDDKRLIRQILSRQQVMERRLGIEQPRDISGQATGLPIGVGGITEPPRVAAARRTTDPATSPLDDGSRESLRRIDPDTSAAPASAVALSPGRPASR